MCTIHCVHYETYFKNIPIKQRWGGSIKNPSAEMKSS